MIVQETNSSNKGEEMKHKLGLLLVVLMLAAMAVIPVSADGGATTANGWYDVITSYSIHYTKLYDVSKFLIPFVYERRI